MVSLRVEKSFIRVLNALAELEALSSNDAFRGAAAWAGRLQMRVDRYLSLTAHLPSSQLAMNAELILALQKRVKDAVGLGSQPHVFSAAADLREELSAHFRSLHDEHAGHAP